MPKISFWSGNGGLFSAVSTLIDMFSVANLSHSRLSGESTAPLFETEILTTDGLPIEAYGGIRITPHRSIREVSETDCVIVAPYMIGVSPMPDGLELLSEWLAERKENGTVIATGCTGTFILAELGLLNGKAATTNWQFVNIFRKRYPEVKLHPEHMLIEDDGIISTGATTAVANLGMHLIRKFGSQKLLSTCAKILLMDPNRYSQLPYMVSVPFKNHGDKQVLKAQQMIEEQYKSIGNIDTVAGIAGISPRHFKRRFKQATGELPLKYLQQVRINAAKDLLETTRKPIEEITWDVGYRDVSSFCRLFRQVTEMTLGTYREKFTVNLTNF
jgi:transcriptional regulator GlxA family with amidase domain